VDPDFVFIVSYSCPRCHAALEARASGAPSWLRCPSCGRASLPPEHNRAAPSPFVDDQTLIIGNFTTGGAAAPLPLRPRAMVPLPLRQSPPTPTARLLLGTGFFLTTALFLFSLLDSNGGRAVIFGIVAVICLILLARQSGRPPAD
jgi:hypothetical protein